ncbi:MAG: hypothetical protein ABI461_04595 [Polyangiaceae bacterium]
MSVVAIGTLSGAACIGVASSVFAQTPLVRPGTVRPLSGQHAATAATPASAAAPATATTTIASAGQTTPQKTRLAQYVDKINAQVHTAVHAGGKVITQDERNAVKDHWRLSMRLLRVRDVAEAANDPATMQQVDADLAVLDAHFQTQMAALNAKAPK